MYNPRETSRSQIHHNNLVRPRSHKPYPHTPTPTPPASPEGTAQESLHRQQQFGRNQFFNILTNVYYFPLGLHQFFKV